MQEGHTKCTSDIAHSIVKEGQYFIAEQNRRSERLEIEGCRDGEFLFNLSGKSIFIAISFAAQRIVLKKKEKKKNHLHLRTSNSLSRTMHSEDTKENVLQKPSTTGARKKWFLDILMRSLNLILVVHRWKPLTTFEKSCPLCSQRPTIVFCKEVLSKNRKLVSSMTVSS